MNNKTKISWLLSVIFILSLIILALILYYNAPNIRSSLHQDTNFTEPELQIEQDEPRIEYRMWEYSSREDHYLLDTYNLEVAIESLNDACGEPVQVYVNDNDLQLFVLRDKNFGSGRPLRRLYKVDPETLECDLMKVSSEVGDFGGYRQSPDSTKVAISLESSPRIIKVLDLIEDTSTVVAQAQPGQTFNAGWGALSNNFVFIWTDNQTLQYDTFVEVSYEQRTVEGGKPLISTEVIRVE